MDVCSMHAGLCLYVQGTAGRRSELTLAVRMLPDVSSEFSALYIKYSLQGKRESNPITGLDRP
jgi:hypothetical protein